MDATTINAMIASAKTGLNVLKTLSNINTQIELKGTILELHGIIESLQEQISAFSDKYNSLRDINREMEKKLKQYEDWSIEKENYKLVSFASGTKAYIAKDFSGPKEKAIWFCVNCFQSKKKSVLQPKQSGLGTHLHCSAGCDPIIIADASAGDVSGYMKKLW